MFSNKLDKKIFLTLMNGTGYIFDVEDYMDLRMQHRIVGNFVGTIASPDRYGLPAELTIFETRLLIEEGIAQLVSKSESLLRPPTTEELVAYEKASEARLTAQAGILKAERLRDAERNMEHIISGKRRKLLLTDKPTDNITCESVLEEISNQFVFEKKNAFIEITCAHPEQHEARIVELPPFNDTLDKLKYRVFRKYWQLGKFVTPGDAFGGDFLIYPGDPMRYHASHVVIVINRPKAVRLLDIISKVRLTVVVNKTCVIAYTAEDGQGTNCIDPEITYQTIEWDGNNESETFGAESADLQI